MTAGRAGGIIMDRIGRITLATLLLTLGLLAALSVVSDRPREPSR